MRCLVFSECPHRFTWLLGIANELLTNYEVQLHRSNNEYRGSAQTLVRYKKMSVIKGEVIEGFKTSECVSFY